MNTSKLYVGNLSYKADEQTLADLFKQAGEVTSAKIIVDKMSGRSKGFGFVEMATTEEAAKAIEMFNNFSYMERQLVVNEAKPQEKKSFGDRGDRFSRRDSR
ncbi:RNA-binding protein [bacterium]|jgi:cold-inducible RNA-binding protein|nr:MAG: RNA-binding protein [bacterium]MBL7959062.1 RNA-binding protein [bacterium]